ncbi:MAG: phytanoyl-CoA dioxygenase family protein [Chloroflexi bacterium]|nr:phytanoyl-CoA dioxygenase family protein [Chloroflexota bacterium]
MIRTDYVTTPDTLTDETIGSYQQQGFVRIPGIISREEAAEFYDEALALMERSKAYSNSPIFTQLVNVWCESDVMKRLTLHPNVGGVAERLARMPLRLWHDHLLIKRPHNQASTEFHQDRPYWPFAESRHSLSAWIALTDVPVERGCMTFIPGSFKRTDLRPQNLADEDDLFSIWPDLAWEPRVTIPLKAGDCTFHHGYCAHMATPNFTDVPRVAHIVIFTDAETTYKKQPHVVTDPLGLADGQPLEHEMFPRAGR